MTTTLFINAKIIDPEAGTEALGALRVGGGVIKEVLTQTPENAEMFRTRNKSSETVVDCGGKYLAPGIVDIGVKVCEPGERHKESYRTAGLAAAAGGVTTMITRPDTAPAIDNPEALEFVIRRARETAPVRVHAMAALTKGRMGREMTEIGFLMDAGAIAFTDCDAVVTDTKVLSRALTYARSLGALVIAHPQEPILSAGGGGHLGQVRLLARFACRVPHGRTHGVGPRHRDDRDDRRALSCGPDHHRARFACAGTGQSQRVGHHCGHLDPPPDPERFGRGGLPHVLQTQAAAARRGPTGLPWARPWPPV